MNKIDQITKMLKDGIKISQALKEVCGSQKISIPFNDEDFDVPLEKLDLSVRSYNALKRSKLNTLNEVINHFAKNGWNSIKTFGRTSATEMFEKIIEVAWDNMTSSQKVDFLMSI
jgi:DNA-directed RNA polymerase alpha subunit